MKFRVGEFDKEKIVEIKTIEDFEQLIKTITDTEGDDIVISLIKEGEPFHIWGFSGWYE